MYLRLILVYLLVGFYPVVTTGQVRVRLFSSESPESVVFSVNEGKYQIIALNGSKISVNKGASVVISKFNGKLAVKAKDANGFICDSVIFKSETGADYFSIRFNGRSNTKQYYSGDLQVLP